MTLIKSFFARHISHFVVVIFFLLHLLCAIAIEMNSGHTNRIVKIMTSIPGDRLTGQISTQKNTMFRDKVEQIKQIFVSRLIRRQSARNGSFGRSVLKWMRFFRVIY